MPKQNLTPQGTQLMELQIKFNKNDKDSVGNEFPALYIRYDGNEMKFITQDDLPRMYGLKNGAEIMDSDQKALMKFQVTPDFFQPYAAFCDDRIMLWHPNVPAFIRMYKGDLEIPYSKLSQDWQTIHLEN